MEIGFLPPRHEGTKAGNFPEPVFSKLSVFVT
jgi:hypothetical protein